MCTQTMGWHATLNAFNMFRCQIYCSPSILQMLPVNLVAHLAEDVHFLWLSLLRTPI